MDLPRGSIEIQRLLLVAPFDAKITGFRVGPTVAKRDGARCPVTIKSLFHVKSRVIRQAPEKEPSRAESIVDIAVDWEEARPLRGVSESSWSRARGWSTED